VRADEGGARTPASARLLWERTPGAARAAAGKPVFALMINGAQGDDDEAHGGHFAVATGHFGARGEWNDWLVGNFYNLDSQERKGIVASTLTMDAYLTDLNSGQAWYRPSAVLVAVLREPRAALLAQQGIARVFNHFYRHDFSLSPRHRKLRRHQSRHAAFARLGHPGPGPDLESQGLAGPALDGHQGHQHCQRPAGLRLHERRTQRPVSLRRVQRGGQRSAGPADPRQGGRTGPRAPAGGRRRSAHPHPRAADSVLARLRQCAGRILRRVCGAGAGRPHEMDRETGAAAPLPRRPARPAGAEGSASRFATRTHRVAGGACRTRAVRRDPVAERR
jgi:hypothetical protein